MQTIIYLSKEGGKLRPLTFAKLIRTVNSKTVKLTTDKATNTALVSDARAKAYRSLPRVYWGAKANVNGEDAIMSGVLVYKVNVPNGADIGAYYETNIKPSIKDKNIIFAYPDVGRDIIYVATFGIVTRTNGGYKYPLFISIGEEACWIVPMGNSIIIPTMKNWLYMDCRKIYELLKTNKTRKR